MLGFSLYPHHLKGGSDCTLQDFSNMIRECCDRYGAEHLGIGSDLCQDQPDSVVTWMRNGRWSKVMDFGEGSASAPGFPPQPEFFGTNVDFPNFADGLSDAGLSDTDIQGIMGGNWARFYADNFGPMQ